MLLSLLGLHTAIAFGQSTSTTSRVASLTTIVFDPSGAIVPNAEVMFKGERAVTTQTSSDGSVQLSLPYGHYDVTITSPGFKTTKVIAFQVDSAKPPVLNVVLQVSPTVGESLLGEEMVVTTIVSDLPNIIEPSVASPIPIGGGPMVLHPSVYMQSFRACSAEKPCTRRGEFQVDSVPRGCCTLTVTNGDGWGTDEVSSYRVFFNGKRVLATGLREAQVPVKPRQQNVLKLVLRGQPSSKVFVSIAYDPRESK
jgi:hypothetical protein